MPGVAVMVTGIVRFPISSGLPASTHTDTEGVPSVVANNPVLKCRSSWISATEKEVVSL